MLRVLCVKFSVKKNNYNVFILEDILFSKIQLFSKHLCASNAHSSNLLITNSKEKNVITARLKFTLRLFR